MQNYLQRYCDDATIVARLLDDLQSRGYLCEARLAEQVIRARRPRASASRVRQELARRGIAGEVIADSTVGLEASDLQAALALWRKRFRAPATDRVQRERQLRYLRNRGFNHAIALKVLRAVGDDDEFDPGQ